MRTVRVLSVLIFVVSTLFFGYYKREQALNKDITGPVITMDSDSIRVPSNTSRELLLKGVRAEDKKDGDVSESLIVESMSNFIEDGRREITIAAFDSSNNISKVTREVIYTDYEPPKFSLEAPFSFPLDTQEILQSLKAEDKIDGDLTGRIKMSTEYYVQVDEEGVYPMLFTVSNSAGDVAKLPVNIEIYDSDIKNSQPQIELSEYLIYTEKGQKITPWDYVKQLNYRGREYVRDEEEGALYDLELQKKLNKGEEISKDNKLFVVSKEFQIESKVNYDAPGVYEVIYKYDAVTDKEDLDEEDYKKSVGTVRLIVIVTE